MSWGRLTEMFLGAFLAAWAVHYFFHEVPWYIPLFLALGAGITYLLSLRSRRR